MNENDQTCKSFNQPEPGAPELPPPLDAWFVERQLYRGLDAEDLREMSKYSEIPNLAGLAAHAVELPATEEIAEREDEPHFSEDATRALRWGLLHDPCVAAEGALAGAAARPVRVRVIAPQRTAHLAQAFARMLWPEEGTQGTEGTEENQSAIDYTLFIWPEPLLRKNGSRVLEHFVGHWPGRGLGVVIGFDDPALGARMLAAAARRVWAAETPGARVVESDAGESWKREEVLAEESGAATALWANPLLPATALARSEQGRKAALALGALPLDVAVDGEGRFTIFEDEADAGGDEAGETRAGWVVVPRAALG